MVALSLYSPLLLQHHNASSCLRRHKIVAKDEASTSGRSSTKKKKPPPPSLAVTICDALDDYLNAFHGNPPSRSLDPAYVLTGNFAPAAELGPVPCKVVRGAIPPCLGGGAYVRNGPNPQFATRSSHHFFDGDGMLHSLLLPHGGGSSAPAVYCSRYVETYRYCLERDAGRQVLPKLFSAFYGLAGVARGAVMVGRAIAGQINPLEEGFGLANTSLLYMRNELLALDESDLPYVIHLSPDGEISTRGREDFDGKLSPSMTAHPKKDFETGEVFAFRHGPLRPYLTYFRFDDAGNKQPDVPIHSINRITFQHDFAVTRKYAIFTDTQLVIDPMKMVTKGGSIVGVDSDKVTRVGVIPKYAASDKDMRWFEVPGFNVAHIINAWDDDEVNGITLVAPNVHFLDQLMEKPELVRNQLEMVRIDLLHGKVTRKQLSAGNFELGVINPRYVGRKSRYAYVQSISIVRSMSHAVGVAKVDFDAAIDEHVVAVRNFPKGVYGNELFFVPNGGEEAEEDDGYVVMFLQDENKDQSSFIVMDARSPELEIVAEVLLPQRVPYGLHGLFVDQKQLQAQKRNKEED